MDRIDNTRRTILICVLLGAVTIALYWPATGHDFVNYDDPLYVAENPHVQAGLTWAGLAWAFGRVHGYHTYWHPLSWVSHMADCQLYGLKPWGHHLTSLLFHAANAVLVFLVFRRMTGAFWRCAVLAALFALHPLQVDSVAWVTERKNLLSAFFWLLTMWAYARYAEGRRQKEECRMQNAETSTTQHATGTTPRSTAPSSTFDPSSVAVLLRRVDVQRSMFDVRPSLCHLPSAIFYLLALIFFALGLMCKPTLVTLPFVLLLLDFWPLGRLKLPRFKVQSSMFDPSSVAVLLRRVDVRRSELIEDQSLLVPAAVKPSASKFHPSSFILHPLLLEKLPFLILAACSSAITFVSHQALGMLDAVSRSPWDARLENALVSYGRYLGKTFWPSRLAVFYPYPAAWPMWEVVACGLLLLVISGLVLGTARSRPSLFVGWFWFLGVLVPFIGLVQAGDQAMADRFMYVPALGIFVAMIWGLHGLASGRRYQQIELLVAASAAVIFCLVLTRQQLGHWKNSETLFRHALEVTENNYLAHNNLGNALDSKGQLDEAISQYREAIRLRPGYALACYNLGNALARKGQFDEAIGQYREAIRLRPDYAKAHINLGNAFSRKGQLDEAIRQYREVIRLEPDFALAHNNLGAALLKKGQLDEAISQFQEALRLKPDFALARNNLARAREMKNAPANR